MGTPTNPTVKPPPPSPAPKSAPALDPEAEQILIVDEHHLDKECVKLPTQYVQWAAKSAERKAAVDELKAGLDLVEAQLGAQIRAAPTDFGIEKCTEGSMREILTQQQDYQDALKRLNKAKYRFELAQAVVWALEHKKRSLTLLVELHGMGYFSSPKVSPEGQEAVQHMSRTRSTRRREDQE